MPVVSLNLALIVLTVYDVLGKWKGQQKHVNVRKLWLSSTIYANGIPRFKMLIFCPSWSSAIIYYIGRFPSLCKILIFVWWSESTYIM